MRNIGKTSNIGFDLSVTSVNIQKKNFTWTTNFNISHNRNKIEALSGERYFLEEARFGYDQKTHKIEVGKPIGQFYGYKTSGLYQIEDFDYDAKNQTYTLKEGVPYMSGTFNRNDVRPGMWKFEDRNGDKIIDDLDMTVIGNANPDFYGGLNNQFKYKEWDFSLFFTFSYGGEVLNATKLTNTKTATTNYMKVVNDCTYLLKSHTVLDEVIGRLHLDVSYEDLYDCVSTSNPEDTRILEVTVRSDSPENAKRIVDQVCTIGAQRIEDAMGFQQVNLYEFGTTDPEPCNRTGLTTFLLAAIAAALAAYIVLLVIFLMDDRIKTDEDIQQMLGLSVLASIPCADGKKTGKYGYYRAYGAKERRPYQEKRKSGGQRRSEQDCFKAAGC